MELKLELLSKYRYAGMLFICVFYFNFCLVQSFIRLFLDGYYLCESFLNLGYLWRRVKQTCFLY